MIDRCLRFPDVKTFSTVSDMWYNIAIQFNVHVWGQQNCQLTFAEVPWNSHPRALIT